MDKIPFIEMMTTESVYIPKKTYMNLNMFIMRPMLCADKCRVKGASWRTVSRTGGNEKGLFPML